MPDATSPDSRAVWDSGFPAAGRVVRPLPGQIQLPVQRARCCVGGSMDADCGLAVRPFPDRSAVLAGDPDRPGSASGKRHVVDHPHLRRDRLARPLGDPPPHRPRVPRRLVHELLQSLHVPVRQPLGHRLDRLAPAIQHQAPQITLAPPPLIPPWQRPEHIGNELRQLTPEPFHFPRPHPRKMPNTRRDHPT